MADGRPIEPGAPCAVRHAATVAGGATPRPLRRPPRRGSRWVSAALGVGLMTLATTACNLLPSEQVSMGNVQIVLPPPPAPLTVKVAQGDVTLSAQVAGQVQSTNVQNLYFNTGGRVGHLAVSNGDHVAAGQILASLDTGNLPFNIENDQLSIERDTLNIQQLQQQDAASPPLNQDQAQQQAIQMQQAQLGLQQDQTNLAADQKQLADAEVIAPFAGVVNDIAINPGDQVSGFQVVMDISDPSSQAFIAKLDSTTAQELSVGVPFTLTLSADNKSTYHGTIATVVVPTPDEVAAAEQTGNPNGIPVPEATLKLTDYPGTPRLGSTFTATINIQQSKNVLYLPTDAVHQFNGSSFVDLYDNGVITEQPVQVGLQGDTNWEIQTGVKLGEQVVEP
ncbi:MAG TPA: efflux RND transporter periplasmic adaptor subunit [Bacillota bacterium]|nr:efflux RND transporter periplasmic adaptor subunit [Bacillota bacterium]